MSYLRRQVVVAALTANAVRPVPGYWAGVPAMLGGWLTSELAPHLLTLTVVDTVREVVRGGRNRAALGLAGASAVGLASMIFESERAKSYVDEALVDALGAGYRGRLTEKHADI